MLSAAANFDRLIQMRVKPRPSDLVAKQALGEAVELGRGRKARSVHLFLLTFTSTVRSYSMLEKQTFRRGFQFRLRSDTTAESRLRQWSGCCSKVWNLALAEQQARRERGEKYAGYIAMAKRLSEWRKAPETEYLADVPIHVLQNVLKSLDEAFQDFFKKAGGYPKFKCYGQEIGLRETDIKCFAVDNANGRIKFPKLGWLRYRKSRDIEGTPKIVTITRQPNGWHVSIMTETQIEQPIPVATTIGAGDRGITNFLATDSGRLVAPLNAHRKVLVKLRRYQRAVARNVAIPTPEIARAKSSNVSHAVTKRTQTLMQHEIFWPLVKRFWRESGLRFARQTTLAKRTWRARCNQAAR